MKMRHKKMARCLYRTRWEKGFWVRPHAASMRARLAGYIWWRSFKGVK